MRALGSQSSMALSGEVCYHLYCKTRFSVYDWGVRFCGLPLRHFWLVTQSFLRARLFYTCIIRTISMYLRSMNESVSNLQGSQDCYQNITLLISYHTCAFIDPITEPQRRFMSLIFWERIMLSSDSSVQ